MKESKSEEAYRSVELEPTISSLPDQQTAIAKLIQCAQKQSCLQNFAQQNNFS